jgi:hypothetical protein
MNDVVQKSGHTTMKTHMNMFITYDFKFHLITFHVSLYK